MDGPHSDSPNIETDKSNEINSTANQLPLAARVEAMTANEQHIGNILIYDDTSDIQQVSHKDEVKVSTEFKVGPVEARQPSKYGVAAALAVRENNRDPVKKRSNIATTRSSRKTRFKLMNETYMRKLSD